MQSLVVIDAPLLFETIVLEYLVSPIVVVSAGLMQKQRLIERNLETSEEADRKIKAQLPISEKIKRADIVIKNDKTLKELEYKIENEVIPEIVAKKSLV